MEAETKGKLMSWLRAPGYEQATATENLTKILPGVVCSKLAARSLIYRPKYFALRSVYSFHFSGRSSSAKMADTGHTGTQAPQSMHSTGSIYSISSVANLSESFLG